MTDPTRPVQPQPGILAISPYVGGESRLAGVADVLKLSSNENPFGPSPKAVAAFREAAGELALYPDGHHSALREALAEVHGIPAQNIVCGAGSDEIIALLCQAYAGPGDEVIHTRHGFAMYRISALAAGATPVEVAEDQRRTDVAAILAAVTERTRLIFLANPNNPTGTMIGEAEVAHLADALPPHALLVLDGAYAEYVEGFDAGREVIAARQNVVMTRTFSKIYGLAALRVGWCYAPDHVVDVLHRIRGPFNVALPALAAAEAAARDTEWTARCAAANAEWRDWLATALRAAGIPCDPPFGNFVLARFATPEAAQAADRRLRQEGVIVRGVASYNLPAALRITVGDETACRRVADILSAFMADQAA
ncbi:MAG: histidinol-phosphate transaminase [Pseudomonadota bacterium]